MFRPRQYVEAPNDGKYPDTDPVLSVLGGDLSDAALGAVSKIAPRGKIKIIFSSTFTDTGAERNCLLEELYPDLQARGRECGVSIVFVDMRYGVKDENTNDHLTWIACADQIRRCFEESDGLFFVSLQGDKYGYMPLPKFLPIRARNPEWPNDTLALFDVWYSLDENAVGSQYVLKNLTGDWSIDKEYWGDSKSGITSMLSRLREALDGISFDAASSDSILVGRSVTEYEVRLAMTLDPSMNKCFWLRREFNRAVVAQDDTKGLFCDFLEGSQSAVRAKHADLLSTMQDRFPPQEVVIQQAASIESYQAKDADHVQYMDRWKTAMRCKLESDLDAVIAKKNAWSIDGAGRGVPGCDLDEILHHCRLLADKCDSFLARTDLVNQAMSCITQTSVSLERELDICLCIIGVSGSGKTSLMSKLASLSAEAFPSIPVIVRFCGTSQGSVDGLVLVRSICLQIQLVHSLSKEGIPQSYDEAVVFLHDLLVAHPVLLFIDSLDQLTDMYHARSKLSFLVGVRCHPEGRIIVSALPDDKDEVTGQWGRYVYLCDTRLGEFNVPRVGVPTFKSEEKQASDIIFGTLLRQGRSITVVQMQYVLQCLAVEPTALYLHLTTIIARQWTSSWAVPQSLEARGDNICHLEPTVKRIINQIFDSLERAFGHSLTRSSIGFITFAKTGIQVFR